MEQAADEGTTTEQTDLIEVWLAVEPAPSMGCTCVDRETWSVKQSVSMGPDGMEACKLLLDNSQDSSPTYVRSEPDGVCPRAVLERCNCIPSLERIADGKLYYSVTIPHRTILAEIVDGIRETGATVSVTSVRSHKDTDLETPLLTEKQREAFDTAVSLGYYDRPREASLDEIASELGISRSAVSHRLCAVRRRLADHFAEQIGANVD
ncbi:MAG: helix-turn-helix domain-containing protein [Halodesulfurarchaeum sp.]